MKWNIKTNSKIPRLKDAILIEGLPGIGNVGKVAVDFLIDKLKAKKIYDFKSSKFPPSVFINEDNLIELPSIQMYHAKNFLFLAGDVQPIDEESSYEFCEKIIDIGKELGVKKIITLGGIGLQETPKEPKVYCTGNSKEMIDSFNKDKDLSTDAYGSIGPIIGVSGLLLGLAECDAIALLAETYGHPMFLGVSSARRLVEILDRNLSLGIDIKEFDKELGNIEPDKALGKVQDKLTDSGDVNYIG